MHGDIEEEVEGTELAAEFTFSSLQKFGQEFLMKLRGKKLPNNLLKKVSKKYIVRIPFGKLKVDHNTNCFGIIFIPPSGTYFELFEYLSFVLILLRYVGM